MSLFAPQKENQRVKSENKTENLLVSVILFIDTFGDLFLKISEK